VKDVKVGIVGASGYSGAVCAAILARHPKVDLAFATSDKAAGEPLAPRVGLSDDVCKLQLSRHEDADALAKDVDAVVLATSAEVSMGLAMKLAEHTRVLDLSGAFRLDAASYPRWYGFEHRAAPALAESFYGLPDLFGAPPKDARIVANPGCYATAALLAIAPLFRDELAFSDRVIIDGKSGVTGAGRKSDEAYSFVELAEDVRAYRVGSHQHTPEIARHLHKYVHGVRPRVTFTPHLLPLRRGLIVTAYMTAREGATTNAVQDALAKSYEDAPFIRVVSVDRVSAHAVAGTPFAYVGATVVDATIVSVCAIDNLMKGAASQAVQNLNLWFGLDERAGLDSLPRFAP
jgi:N-acetyl-gamma-glutamyl-phosphate reductase